LKTRILKVRKTTQIHPAVLEACQVLSRGGLVGFPTETVYGLAASIDNREGLERLQRVKQRPAGKPFTLHIGDIRQLARYVPRLSFRQSHFLRKALPGPVTIIFPLDSAQMELIRRQLPLHQVAYLYHNNSIGIRLPDNEVARQMLSAMDTPVVASSANLSGSPSPTCPEEVLEQLDGNIEILLDGGPTKYAKDSTIIQLDSENMEIIRSGVFDAAALERMRAVNILFVCTGNTCRSPMAEGIYRSQLAKKLGCGIDQLTPKGYKVGSAGVMAFEGARATEEAVEACRAVGVDISGHQSRALTVELINQADYILVMQDYHRQAVLEIAPQAQGRVYLLAGVKEVADPIGASRDVYRRCAAQIAEGIAAQMEQGILA